MEISRTNWESMRPAALKGKGTGQFIDAYLAIRRTEVDRKLAETNYWAAVSLNNHLADVRKKANKDQFFDEKNQTKWEKEKETALNDKKPFKKASPEDLGKENFNAFFEELGRWKEEINQLIPKLKKDIEEVDEKQQESLTTNGETITNQLKRKYTEDCLSKVKNAYGKALGGDTPLRGKELNLMIEAAKTVFKKSGKIYDVYCTEGAILGKAVEMFKLVNKVAPDDKNYPKNSWHVEFSKLRAEAQKMITEMENFAEKSGEKEPEKK